MKRRRNARDERGAVVVLAAVGMVLAMISASLAVDLGTLAQEARDDQKVADLAALDGVRSLPGDPTAAALASAARNDFECPDLDPTDGCGLTVQWGDGVSGVFTSLPATLPLATSVRVTAKSPHNNNFPFSPSGASVTRKGTAGLGNGTGCFYPDICEQTPGVTETSISPLGTVRVGSTLASITSSESVILNTLLQNTVGGSFTLGAVEWQGLANGNVSLERLRTALGASAGTPDGVLDANMKYRTLLNATVDALNADGSPSSLNASALLVSIRNQVSATAGTDLRLRRFFEIVGNVGSGNDVADATINVKDIVVGGLILADANQFASMDLTAADIPGLPGTGVTVKFGLIEAPQTRSGPPKDSSGVYRTTARTAQIRLLVESNVVVPIPLLGNIALKVPYYLSGAGATASLDTLNCPAGATEPTSVTVLGRTEVASTSLGTVSDANLKSPSGAVVVAGPATIGVLTTALVEVRVKVGGGVVSSVPGHSGLLTFTAPYNGTETYSVPGTTALTLPTTLTGSLIVELAGTLPIGLSLLDIQSAIYAVVNPTLAPLNTLVVKPLQRSLGLSLGAGDVWAPPVQTCAPTSFNTDPTSSYGPDTPFGYQIPSLVG